MNQLGPVNQIDAAISEKIGDAFNDVATDDIRK